MISIVFVVAFVQVVLTMLAAIIIFRSYIGSRLTSELYLGLLFLLLTVWGLVEIAVSQPIFGREWLPVLRPLSLILGPCSFVFTYLFITDIVERKHNLVVFGAILVPLGVLSASAVIYENAHGVWLVGIRTLISNTIIPYSILFTSLVSGVYLIYKMAQFYRSLAKMPRWSGRVRQQLILILLGCAISNFGFFIAVLAQMMLKLGLLFHITMSHYVAAWGALIILFAYMMIPHAPYMLMAHPSQLIVIHESGLPCFVYNFSEEVMDEMLLSGLLRAIFSVGDEFFGAYRGIRQFIWGEANVLVKPITSAMVVLISLRHHPLLNSKVEDFAYLFNRKYKDILPQWSGDPTVFKDAYKILEAVFPFIGQT